MGSGLRVRVYNESLFINYWTKDDVSHKQHPECSFREYDVSDPEYPYLVLTGGGLLQRDWNETMWRPAEKSLYERVEKYIGATLVAIGILGLFIKW